MVLSAKERATVEVNTVVNCAVLCTDVNVETISISTMVVLPVQTPLLIVTRSSYTGLSPFVFEYNQSSFIRDIEWNSKGCSPEASREA